ncbi:MAG: pyridoxal-phosphate dependent enzyme, partial [Bacteroidales bacterium]|nr:pyridoxal-phosphate dependent enzyme [Bacteroidales bacterium]
MIKLSDIIEAYQRISSFIIKTSIFSSETLNNWLGHELFFKAECMQKVGAFKARGACNTISWLVECGNRPNHVVSNSSGNHAQAVAWAASLFDIGSTIFMPDDASEIKIQATKSY